MNNEALVTETRRTGTDPAHISPQAVVFHTVCSNINLDQVAQLVTVLLYTVALLASY